MFESIPTNLMAWNIPERAINLPSYHDIGADDIERVVAVIKRLIN